MEWYGAFAAVNIQAVINELLALRANQEELTKRVTRLETEVEELVRERGQEVRYLRSLGDKW